MKRGISLLCLFLFLASTSMVCAEDPVVPNDVIKNVRSTTGNWTITGALGDAPLEGTATFRARTPKHCILGTVSYKAGDKTSTFSLVSGWDVATGWFTELGVGSDGSVYAVKWRKVSDTVEEGDLVGTMGDKKQTGKVRLERKSKDEIVVMCTEMKTGGEADPDVTFIYKRAAPKKRSMGKDLPGPPTSKDAKKEK